MGAICNKELDENQPYLVELNITLDGSINPSVLWELHENDAEKGSVFELGKFCIKKPTIAGRDWLEPVQRVKNMLLKSDVDVFETIAYQFCAGQRKQLVYYTEVRFEPFAFINEEDYDTVDDVIMAVSRGLQRGEEEFEIVVRGILSCNRSQPDHCQKLIELIDLYDNIVGLNICGDEDVYFGLESFHEPIQRAKSRKQGLNLTVEACSVESISSAIMELKADRIGYATRVQDDKSLCRVIKEKKIHIEGCITASIFLKKEKKESHPILNWKKQGLPFSINSCEPLFLSSPLSTEMRKCKTDFNFSDSDIQSSFYAAAQACFLPTSSREKILKVIESRMGARE